MNRALGKYCPNKLNYKISNWVEYVLKKSEKWYCQNVCHSVSYIFTCRCQCHYMKNEHKSINTFSIPHFNLVSKIGLFIFTIYMQKNKTKCRNKTSWKRHCSAVLVTVVRAPRLYSVAILLLSGHAGKDRKKALCPSLVCQSVSGLANKPKITRQWQRCWLKKKQTGNQTTNNTKLRPNTVANVLAHKL